MAVFYDFPNTSYCEPGQDFKTKGLVPSGFSGARALLPFGMHHSLTTPAERLRHWTRQALDGPCVHLATYFNNPTLSG